MALVQSILDRNKFNFSLEHHSFECLSAFSIGITEIETESKISAKALSVLHKDPSS